VGEKPTTAYVVAALSAFERFQEVRLLARGKAISKAVDAAEMIRKRLPGVGVRHISIGTEEFSNRDPNRRTVRVSTIEIVLGSG